MRIKNRIIIKQHAILWVPGVLSKRQTKILVIILFGGSIVQCGNASDIVRAQCCSVLCCAVQYCLGSCSTVQSCTMLFNIVLDLLSAVQYATWLAGWLADWLVGEYEPRRGGEGGVGGGKYKSRGGEGQ